MPRKKSASEKAAAVSFFSQGASSFSYGGSQKSHQPDQGCMEKREGGQNLGYTHFFASTYLVTKNNR